MMRLAGASGGYPSSSHPPGLGDALREIFERGISRHLVENRHDHLA